MNLCLTVLQFARSRWREFRVGGMLFVAVLALTTDATYAAGDLEFKLITLKTISDQREIGLIRNELLLGSEAIDRIVITDLLNDGFDENDFMQLYPTGRVVRIQRIEPRLDSLLRSYKLPSNVEIHESKSFFTKYDSTSRVRNGGQALGYGLLGGISERLYRGYRGTDVEGYFKFTPSGMAIQAWNFDSTKVRFPPPDAPRVDTFYVYLHDTIRVPEVVTVAAEPIVIRDTVYIPSELLLRPRGMFYRVGLGLVGGSYHTGLREVSRGRLTLGAGNEWDFGVWDPWISGRQDVDSRIGLRFLADMAPWKSDTLSPRFLGTSMEAMYIPAWDRSLFAFVGMRAYLDDDPFWDRARAAWDEADYEEPSAQDLSQYELTFKGGLDKLSATGAGKKLGLWLKLAGFINTNKSGYDVTVAGPVVGRFYSSAQPLRFRWEHSGGGDIELGLNARLSDFAQLTISAGDYQLPNFAWEYTDSTLGANGTRTGLIRAQQIYQTVAVRIAPINSEDARLSLEGWFRNHSFTKSNKRGEDNAIIERVFLPYFETPEMGGAVQLDISFVRVEAGAKYFAPPDGLNAVVRPYGSVHFMIQ
ncbi:hypothetical protein HZB60_10345 [candidate division KSB1 bacterium]|nr:hypothetical protein [candidate division KSB1 bacterium]